MAGISESRQDALRSIQFLEGQTHYPDQRMVNDRLIAEMQLQPGEIWLEVGSGSGALCRQAALSLLPTGCIIGMDASPVYLTEAVRYAHTYQAAAGIHFLAGGGERIPFPSETFTGAFAARLMLNVANPDEILHEMVRVTAAGGRILLMDWDFDTITVHHSQVNMTRRIIDWRADNYGSNSWSGRQLNSRMRKAGLQGIQIHPVVSYGLDNSSAMYDALLRAALAARNGAAITEEEHLSWVAELEEKAAHGDFFASINYFIVSGIK